MNCRVIFMALDVCYDGRQIFENNLILFYEHFYVQDYRNGMKINSSAFVMNAFICLDQGSLTHISVRDAF